MKYNLTNETYLPEAIRYSPGSSEASFGNIFGAAIFYNIIPLIVSFITYYPIVYLTRRLFKTKSGLSLILTGFLLTLTTPLLFFIFSGGKHNDYYMKTAETISWISCFILSVLTYYYLNRESKKI